MSIITFPGTAAEHETELSPRAGLLQRAIAAIIESRRKSAERMIAAYLESQSEQRLADLGFTAADIAAMRARAGRRWTGPAF